MDIYPAGEAPIDGVTSVKLSEQIDHQDCRLLTKKDDPEWRAVRAELKSGDILLTLGAGDVSKLGEQFVETYVKG